MPVVGIFIEPSGSSSPSGPTQIRVECAEDGESAQYSVPGSRFTSAAEI